MTVNEEIAYREVWVGEPQRLDTTLFAQSVLLTSPNGTPYMLTVDDNGTL
jgi:hypothetical protein